VTTDAYNQVYEHTHEDNNTTVASAPITVRLSPFPNLVVSAVTPPVSAFSSQQTVVQWTVRNSGNGATSTPTWYDGVWLSLDRTFDDTDVFLGDAANPTYLNPGDSYTNSLTVTLPRGIDGNYYFLVKADSRNQVFELSHEDDNLTA